MSGDAQESGADAQASTEAATGQAGQQRVAGTTEPSYGDLLQSPLTKRFAKFSTGVYAAVAVGLGVMFLALKYLGKPALTAASGASQQSGNAAAIAATNFVNTSANVAIYVLPLLAAAIAASVGVYAARELDVSERKLYVAAGVGSFAGAVVFVVLGSFLVSLGFGTATFADGGQAVSKPGTVDVANVVFNGVAVAVGAAVVTLGTAWTDRTLV